MSGVRVGPSAPWMQRRLAAAGMRPISNVVDVSNYVTLELNQPTHAYDLDTLGGGGFRIRVAVDGEELITLDGETRTLTPADLLDLRRRRSTDRHRRGDGWPRHRDQRRDTTVVAHEIAWFTPSTVLQTSSRLGLRSEASARYERGCDPYVIDTAHARFAELLRETCPELVVHAGMADARGESMPERDRTTTVRVMEVNRILGTSLTADDLPPLLDPIGYTVSGDGDTRTVVLPTWRPDSTDEVDVIEEIARHYGYDRLGKAVPHSPSHGGLTVRQQRRRRLREVLLGLGISEAMPNPFLAPDTLAKAGLDGPTINITNPLVVEESVLRTSLRPGLLESVAFNESHRRFGARLFEIGHVYPPGDGELPDEYEALCVVLAGADAHRGDGGVARTVGCARRRRAHRSVAGARRAARDALGDAAGGQGADRSRRRGRPGGPAALRGDGAGGDRRAEPRRGARRVSRSRRSGSRSAECRRAISIWRSCWPTRCRRRSSRRRSGRAPARCSSTSTCSTCSVGRRWATDGAALPIASACRPPTAISTDADIADVRRSVVTATAKLGAELRG